jgi:hypothetical protein
LSLHYEKCEKPHYIVEEQEPFIHHPVCFHARTMGASKS